MEILHKELYSKPGECHWTIQKRDENTLQYTPFSGEIQACATNLQKIGFVSIGRCFESGCTGGCCQKEVSPVAPATKTDNYITFPCGTFEGVQVTSVTTTENKAKVKIKRTFKFDERIVEPISACRLNKPNVGESEIEKTFTRDDSGTWMLDK